MQISKLKERSRRGGKSHPVGEQLNLNFEDGGRGHKPWNVGISRSWRKAKRRIIPSKQQPATLSAPGASFMEDNFFYGLGGRGWFQDDKSALHLLSAECTIVFHRMQGLEILLSEGSSSKNSPTSDEFPFIFGPSISDPRSLL